MMERTIWIWQKSTCRHRLRSNVSSGCLCGNWYRVFHCRMYVKFDNLFSNKAISDNTNMMMNQYQEALFKEIHKSYNNGRTLVLEPILRPIFLKYPYRMWFADDSTSTMSTTTATTISKWHPNEWASRVYWIFHVRAYKKQSAIKTNVSSNWNLQNKSYGSV